jgi:sodium-dependent dicarboxylate transporter 2/3/5
MATWWVTEALHLAATSLIPLVAFPLLGIATVKEVSPAYADRFILLLMGGFFVALTLEKWNLHRRIALTIMRRIGTEPRRLVLSFMITTAVLSMWISNTATTLMMLPIAMAILVRMSDAGMKSDVVEGVGIALMLGIAYAASIGGMGTPIGTPPNIIFLKLYEEQFPDAEPIGFLTWMLLALPVVAVMLAVTWAHLVYRVGKIPGGLGDDSGPVVEGQESQLDVGSQLDVETGRAAPGYSARAVLEEEQSALGPITRPEVRVAIVFAITAALWVFRRSIPLGDGGMVIPGWSDALGLAGKVDDSTVALAAALAMFVLPAGTGKRGERLLDWATAVKIPWGLLLLFGGGIALARGFANTGLSAFLGAQLVALSAVPVLVMVAVTALLVTFLTEVTSNTATTNILIPILGAAAVAMEANPLLLMLPATLSASCAFMLPVATAPNAIVFGSGWISIPQMARAGFALNLVGVVVISLLLHFVAFPMLGAL